MITLKAAYGRNYDTEKEALLAWIGGKDFKIVNGPYCSIRDIESLKANFGGIQIRYGEFGTYRYSIIYQSEMEKVLWGLTTEV